MSNFNNMPPQFPVLLLHTLLGVRLAPLASSNSSLSLLSAGPKSEWRVDSESGSLDRPTRAPPNQCNAASATAQTINITTLNVTYGDHYGEAIHNGCIGGRRNENYFEPPACTLALP